MLFELSTLDSGPSDSRKPEGLTLIQPRVQPWVCWLTPPPGFDRERLKPVAAGISGKIVKVNPIRTTIIERGGIKWNQLNIARLEYFASDRATK
jgi:hypothetical protein